MYKIVANFEAVPNNELLDLIDVSESPTSKRAIDLAFSWAKQSGNNIMQLASKAGYVVQKALPWVGPAIEAADAIGWKPLPQRVQQLLTGRRRRSHFGMGSMLQSKRTSGKDEESDDEDVGEEVGEALMKFEALQVRDKDVKSPQTVVGDEKKISSPSLLRKFGKGGL
jgi:hypothetical protein